jgi:hypothetical protein
MEQLLDNRKADLIAALENALQCAHLISYSGDEAHYRLVCAMTTANCKLSDITLLMQANDETETIADVLLPLMED